MPTRGVDSLHWPKRAQKQVTKRVRLPVVVQKDPNVILDVGVDITVTHTGLRRLELKFEVTEPPKTWLVSDQTFTELQSEDVLDYFEVKFSRTDDGVPHLEFWLSDIIDWRGFYEKTSQYFRNRIIMC